MKIFLKFFFSRVAISAIYFLAIPRKINIFERIIEYIYSKGISDPIASVLLVGAIICLILCWVQDFLYLEKIKKSVQYFYYFFSPKNSNLSFNPFPSKNGTY